MTGTVIDSLVIGTLTGLSLIVTDVFTVEGLSGNELTEFAFNTILPTFFGLSSGSILLMICL